MLRCACALLASALVVSGCGGRDTEPESEPDAGPRPPPADAALIAASDLDRASPTGYREVLALREDGSGVVSLTRCGSQTRRCDVAEAAPAPDRERLVLLRARDGKVPPSGAAGLVVVDLATGVERSLVADDWRVRGADWSPREDVVVFSAIAPGQAHADLYRIDADGSRLAALTTTGDLDESHPRIDPTGTLAAYERRGDDEPSRVWLFVSSRQQSPLTPGAEAGALLDAAGYRVGAEASPDFSPDGRSIVYRRLTAADASGWGHWQLQVRGVDGSQGPTLADGPAYRGPPDWGPRGIVFEEADGESRRLVCIQPDGSGRRVLATVGTVYSLSAPRWLP